MSGVLDPADPQTLLRRIAALERRVTALSTTLAGAQYASDEGGGSRTVASTGSFLDYTGQPVITLAVPESGRVRATWGFVGWNSASATSTLRVAPTLSVGNISAATTSASAVTSGDNIGAGTDAQAAPRSPSRTRIYEGLTPGSTTFTLQARISSGTTLTHAIQDSWLLVEPMP